MGRQCKAINIRWTDDKAKMLNVQRQKRHNHLFYLSDKRHDYSKTFNVFFIKNIEKTTTEWDTGTDEHSSECSSNAIVFTHCYISHGYLVEMQFVASAGSHGTFGAWIIMNSTLFKKKLKANTHTHTHSGTELLLLSFGCVKTFSFPHFNHVLKGPVPKSLVKYFYQEVLNLITSRFHQERSSAPNSFPLFIHLFFSIML